MVLHTLPLSQTSPNPPPGAPQGHQMPWVGARLQSFWRVWEEQGASPWVVSVLRDGYNLKFEKDPPLTRVPNLSLSGSSETGCPGGRGFCIDAQRDYRGSAGPYINGVLFKDISGDWRPIIALSVLNTFLKCQMFKMESAESIRPLLFSRDGGPFR